MLLKYIYTGIITFTLLFTTILFIIKDKKIFFIWSFPITAMMWCFLFKHAGYSHHYIFFWIYTLVGYWLFIDKYIDNNRLIKFAQIIFAIFFAIMLFSKGLTNDSVYRTYSKTISTLIRENTEAPARVILITRPIEAIAPYLENDDIEIYTYEKAAPVGECGILNVANDKKYFNIIPQWLQRSITAHGHNYVLMPDNFRENKEPPPLKFAAHGTTIYMLPVVYIKNKYILYKVLE